MSTNFPTSLDAYADVPQAQNTATAHRDRHQNLDDAMEAVQAKIGVNNSTDQTSLDYRVSLLEGSTGLGLSASLVSYTIPATGGAERTQESKNADFLSVKDFGAVGDGVTNDTAAINAALAYIDASGSPGRLLFPAGRYQTDGGHQITVPCVIAGEGYGTIASKVNGSSVIALRANANASIFTIASTHVTIEDLGFYGNKANQSATSHGIATSALTASNYFRINRVWVDAFRDDGIHYDGPGASLEGLTFQCRVSNCGGYGYNFNTNAASDCQLTDCISSLNGTGGAQVNAGSIAMTGCHIWGNTGHGVVMPSGAGGFLRMVNCYVETNTGNAVQPRGQGNQLVGCYLWKNNARGVYAFSNTGLVITGCVIRDNNRNNASGDVGAGVTLDTCTSCVTSNNWFQDSGVSKFQSYGYAEVGNTCNACVFIGNSSRAADHKTGNWLIGTGNPTATIPATPASFNAG